MEVRIKGWVFICEQDWDVEAEGGSIQGTGRLLLLTARSPKGREYPLFQMGAAELEGTLSSIDAEMRGVPPSEGSADGLRDDLDRVYREPAQLPGFGPQGFL